MGDQERFLRLFLRCQGEIRAFIGAWVRDPHQREDIFQEVALVLWREFDRYDPTRSFAAWARGIAAKKVWQRWEQARRVPLPFDPETLRAVQEAFERTEGDAELRADALRRCLASLPEKSRRLLALRYEESLKLADIAQRLRSSLDAVHKALSRLRARLQACVERRLAALERLSRGTP
ncbi:MAG: sigma-70 family RNA polymerase sigma factor [Gemmataceae bacterium]|nr:sigma-70 family RNA polymerase sigma factor [Gemmataceae bacterium]MDW8263726.1 sigma-70 family RNA polymerase sigma factor [Gemmataceae bacterium]